MTQIDWSKLEKITNTKPVDMAHLANVTPAMYYAVRAGSRQFSEGSLYQLCSKLAAQSNYKNCAPLLREAFRIVEEYAQSLPCLDDGDAHRPRSQQS